MTRLLALSAFLIVALGGARAWAACEYDGVYYEAGTQLCFGGWLQECTVAGYWGAIGMCKDPDVPEPSVDNRPLAETLFAKALGDERTPDGPQSAIPR